MKLELNLEKLTTEEQKEIYRGLKDTITPFEDCIKLLYQVEYHYSLQDNQELHNRVFNDIIQIAICMSNILQFYKYAPEGAIEKYKENLIFIKDLATQCVENYKEKEL